MAKYIRGDVIGGAILFALGLFAAVNSLEYDMGEFRRMGPGMYPFILSISLMILSALLMILSRNKRSNSIEFDWKNLLAVVASLLFFTVTVKTIGAILAIFVAVYIACALSKFTLVGRLVMSAVVSVGTSLLFVGLLGVSVNLLPAGMGL